jgi:hypothetical protein
LFGGFVGLIITSSIYGSKAQQARNEMNLLIEERRDVEANIATTHEILSSLRTFETKLQDLQVRIEGAEGSSSNLESLWQLIESYIDSSSNKLNGVTDAMYLVLFVSKLKAIRENWLTIKKQAGDLLTAFNNSLSNA